MSVTLRMPALSPTMEIGTLARWNVKIGDKVAPGDVIAEIETDKATMDFEAIDEGVIAHILVDAGATNIGVNTPIAILAEPGEAIGDIPPKVDDVLPGGNSAAKVKGDVSQNDTTETPRVFNTGVVTSSSLRASETISDKRIKISPLARRLAQRAGLDLASLTGSGPHGRIVKRDIETALISAGAQEGLAQLSIAAPAPMSGGLIMPQTLDPRIYAPESYKLVPLDGMRRTVARRLTESFMQVPHFQLQIEIGLDALLVARQDMNALAPEGVKISVNDMLIKASAMALMAEPDCNTSFSDAGIAYHNSAHISVAVAVEGGLITPVIRDAQSKGLADISSEMKDLAARARKRKLAPQEYFGGTFSLSNLGMFGVKSFGSIINPPEGMILSVGAGEKRPIIDEGGGVRTATMLSVTLTCDHRVIGGAEGAKWLQAFKRFVETPASMLL